MIFEYIKFTNYRPYYGEQKIVLHDKSVSHTPRKKNIILIGGLNGAGKTSLINSIYICFFGRRMFKENDYKEIRQNAINRRHRREGGRSSSVELCISDNTGCYIIQVEWRLDHRDLIEETRKIYKATPNGEKLEEIASSEEEFNEFIDRRIPIDVAPFFIFDAEKIRDLVGQHDSQDTIRAIQKIVSLELYNQLLNDLNKISSEETRNLSNIVDDEELLKLTKELQAVTDALDQFSAVEGEERARIDELTERKQTLERQKRAKLAQNSMTKQEISRILGKKEERLKQIKASLENIGKSSLPNMILAPLVKKLQDRLRIEKEFLSAKQRHEHAFSSYHQFMEKLLGVPINPPLTEQQKEALSQNGKKIWADLNRISESILKEEVKILHDLSPGEYNRIQSRATSFSLDVKKILDERYQLEQEIANYRKALYDAPDVIDTSEEDQLITEITKELGALERERKIRNQEKIKLSDRRTQLVKEINSKQKEKEIQIPLQRKINLMNKIIDATKEFIDQVTILKAHQLKEQIELILRTLFRKNDLAYVEFSPEDFTLRIFDEDYEEIDLVSRSEGEKQLIALSMIWALTKVSGTNLPFVIDTPLARLDSIHRSNIVNQYFTCLSDQVIILSTDTEITEDFVEEIKPFVMRSYVLSHDDEEKVTKIEEGYFDFSRVV